MLSVPSLSEDVKPSTPREEKPTQRTGYTKVSNAFLADQSIPQTAKFLLIVLASYTNNQYLDAYPSVKTLSKAIGKREKTTIKYTRWLEMNGYLTVERKRGEGNQCRANLYSFNAKAANAVGMLVTEESYTFGSVKGTQGGSVKRTQEEDQYNDAKNSKDIVEDYIPEEEQPTTTAAASVGPSQHTATTEEEQPDGNDLAFLIAEATAEEEPTATEVWYMSNREYIYSLLASPPPSAPWEAVNKQEAARIANSLDQANLAYLVKQYEENKTFDIRLIRELASVPA